MFHTIYSPTGCNSEVNELDYMYTCILRDPTVCGTKNGHIVFIMMK